MSVRARVARAARAVALLLLCAAPLRAQVGGVVRGMVRDETTGAPLAGAMVEVVGAARGQAVATDGAGSYRLRDLPGGRRVLRASYLGYAPLEIEVVAPVGGEVRVDFALRVSPVRLEPVRVEAGRAPGAADTATAPTSEVGIVGARALDSTPGIAELGLAEAVQRAPGEEPADPGDVLYVRGAASDLKLVYLDGAPIYAPFPLGGLIDAFTPGLLSAADVYLGGAPARYDGGLSYVMDLRTRGVRPDGVHSEGALDLLSGRALIEAPLGEHAGLLLAGRSVHGLGAAATLPYGYREGLVRADVRLAEGTALSVTGFRNAEEVWLEEESSDDSTVAWGNSALSVRFHGPVLGQEAEITASVGDFDARLPIHDRQPRVAEGDAHRLRLSADLTGRAMGVTLRYGASFDRLEQRYRARGPDNRAMGDWTLASGDALGSYLDAGWQAASRLRVRGGMRLDYFSLGEKLVAAPRLSATWLVTERAALTLAVGRYHQYLRASEDALVTASVNQWAAKTLEPLAVGGSSHLALGLDQDLGDGMRLGVEGFFKSFEGMPGASADVATSSGMDVWVRRDYGRLNGWLGYSLAWIWSDPAGSASSQFAGRQLFSAGLDFPLGDRSRFDLRFAYGSGLPYSAIPLAGDVEAPPGLPGTASVDTRESTVNQLSGGAGAAPLLPAPDQPYLRLDLGGSHTWSQRWLGRPTALSSYVRLLNTLGRRDALFYRYDRDRDESPRGMAVLPVVPVVGMEWKF